jgi:hypothetical protein
VTKRVHHTLNRFSPLRLQDHVSSVSLEYTLNLNEPMPYAQSKADPESPCIQSLSSMDSKNHSPVPSVRFPLSSVCLLSTFPLNRSSTSC